MRPWAVIVAFVLWKLGVEAIPAALNSSRTAVTMDSALAAVWDTVIDLGCVACIFWWYGRRA